MSRHTLHVDFDYDFKLISIVSSLRDYRLCWQINRTLRLDLSKKNDLEVTDVKKRQQAHFSLFSHEDEINFLQYFFIGNKASGAYFIPELKQVDYLLMIRGDAADTEKQDILQQLKNLRGMEAVFETDAETLRSKQNLIFE